VSWEYSSNQECHVYFKAIKIIAYGFIWPHNIF
jgi:hypothetical protein